MKIAVIGSGVSGLVSAYTLSKHHHVDLYESEDRLGGHTHTVSVTDAKGQKLAVDTGFIVFNLENYPEFTAFLKELGVTYQNSDMSFSMHIPEKTFYWGSDFPKGVFAQPRHWVSPGFYRFIWGVHRFNTHCLRDAENGLPDALTLGDYLALHRVPRSVILQYVLPMTSAIWSASFEDSLRFPMMSFIRFWKNHQLLEIGKGLQWRTVTGGSSQYIQKLTPHLSGKIILNTPIKSVSRTKTGVQIRLSDQVLDYDAAVIATHADTAYRLCEAPTAAETHLLGVWRYSKNKTYLHTDTQFMPPKRQAWCSWNTEVPATGSFEKPASVTYWMNRLQSLQSATDYFVTLNPTRDIPKTHILKEMTYTHPIMDSAALATQATLPTLNANSKIVFAGSYFGYGFHEDAVSAAHQASTALLQTLATS